MSEGKVTFVRGSEHDPGEDDGYFMLGLADHPDGEGEFSLIITRANAFDEQDRRLGQDTYCIDTAEQNTIYGGVERWSLVGRVLVLHFSREAAAELGLDPVVRLDVQVDDADLRALEDGLARTLIEVPRDDST